MRDVGRLAVILMARPLAAYLNSGDTTQKYRISRYTASEVRAAARERPTTLLDAAASNVYRFLAWIGIFLVSLPTFIVISIFRGALGRAWDGLLLPAMAVTAFTGMFSSISIFIYVTRLTLVRIIGSRAASAARSKPREKRRAKSQRRRNSLAHVGETNRFVMWICTPSHLDAFVALFWALAFTPLIVGDIPH